MDETKKTGMGSIIGTIIIIALIVLGGLYFWGKRLEEAKTIKQMTAETAPAPASVPETVVLTPEEQEANLIKTTSSSDEVSDIEADMKATNLTNLDAELKVQ